MHSYLLYRKLLEEQLHTHKFWFVHCPSSQCHVQEAISHSPKPVASELSHPESRESLMTPCSPQGRGKEER